MPPPRRALRLGLRQIDGFRQAWAQEIMAARQAGAFTSVDDLRARANLPGAALDMLASADALGSLELSRRPGLWAAKGLPRVAPAPLFAAAGLEEGDGRPPEALPRARASEEVVDDYQTIRLSLKAHPVSFLRDRLKSLGASPASEVETVRDHARIAVGGVVLVRQRPGSAKGVVFLTLEDETGVANVVIWPKVFEKYRPVVMGARLMLVRGHVQRAEGVSHLVAEIIEDRTGELGSLSTETVTPQRAPGDGATSSAPDRGERRKPQEADWNDDVRSAHKGAHRDGHGHARRHPRDVRVLPPSRDFH